jgi:CubicO group peptidase (beta-lactamase class C family)
VPAVAAAVVRSSGVVDAAAVGVRKVRSKKAVTVDDCFHLGSCTKSMTASMCAMLVEQGKLKWETTIADAWPDLSAKLDEGFREVTLEQLLCHRSGLPEDRRPDPAIWPKVVGLTGPLPQQRLAVVELVMGREPAYPPGSRFEYANFGVTVAGAMAEAATGEAYESIMRRLLFDPLGMKSAGFGAPGDAGEVNEPRGHSSLLGLYSSVAPGTGADNPPVIAPAGTAHMSITDWAKYAAWHLRGARGEARLISRATFDRIHHDPFGNQYGFGWVVTNREGVRGPVIAHDGSNGMWYAVIWLAPEEDVGFVVAVNAGDDDAAEACRAVLASLIRRHIPPR